jgi:hypothetical protein
MSDEILFQPSAFSKSKAYPGIFIFNTPSGYSIDLNQEIKYTAYSINNNKEYYDVTDLADLNFKYKLIGANGRPSKGKTDKKYGTVPVMPKHEFTDLVNINKDGREQQMVIVWPQGNMQFSETGSVQAVELEFTLTDGSTIESERILYVKGGVKSKKINGVSTKINPFEDNFEETISKVYDVIKDGNKSSVDLVGLAHDLDPFDLTNVNTWRDRATFKQRENNATSHAKKMEIIFPKYMVVVPGVPFFVLAKKDKSRGRIDYGIESFNIEPYADRGFSVEALNFNAKYATDSLPNINDMFLGKTFQYYYGKLNGDLDEYYIIRFVVSEDVEENIPTTVEMTLNFPFGNTFTQDIVISKDIKHLIKQIAVLDRDPKSIQNTMTVDDGDFQDGLEEEPYVLDYDNYEIVKIDKKEDDGNQLDMGDLDDIPKSPDNKPTVSFDEEDEELVADDNDDDDLNKLLAEIEADKNNVPAPAPAPDNDDNNLFGDLGFGELDDNSSMGSLDFEGDDSDDDVAAPSPRFDAYGDEDL